MVKSKASMTARSFGETYQGSAGGYPEEMLGLLDLEGHVSLNPSDYVGYSQEEVVCFLADRPYETAAIFAPDGVVVHMTSQWDSSQAKQSTSEISKVISDMGGTGEGWTHFHNHPVYDPNFVAVPSIFSYKDISVAGMLADFGPRGTNSQRAFPTKFVVLAQNGARHELEYVGDGKKNPRKYGNNYHSKEISVGNVITGTMPSSSREQLSVHSMTR